MNTEPIPGFRNLYEVSDCGKVISLKRGTPVILKPQVTKDGYYTVCLHNRGRNVRLIHRLVAEAFLAQPDITCTLVNHKNHLRHDNRVENLEWVTPTENVWHATKYPLYQEKK